MGFLVNLPDHAHSILRSHGFSEDFAELGGLWTAIDADAGASASVGDAVGGRASLVTGATDNNEVYIHTSELFKIEDTKSIIAQCRLQYSEANTDDANVMFGLMDAIAANALQDDGAGPKASYSGAVFFKVDGGTRWQVESSDSTTQKTTDTEHTAGGAAFHTLQIEINPVNSTEAEVVFSIDTAGGNAFIQCRENEINPRAPSIKHTLDYSNATEIAVVAGVKAGGANSETVLVDLIQAYQRR